MNIQKVFKIAATGLGSIGLVLSVFENYHHFSTVIDENYWVVLAITWILSVAAIWPDSDPKVILGPTATYKKSLLNRVSKYKWIFAVTLVFLISGGYRWYTINISQPGKRPVIKPGDIPLSTSPGFISPVLFQQATAKKSKLLQFDLIPEKTLYTRSANRFKIPYGVINQLYQGQCLDDFDSGSALQALKSYARAFGKTKLLKYFENEQQLKALVKDHPDVVSELIPNKLELQKMDRPQYNAILGWIRNCIGIFFPVFIIAIENPTDQDLLITEVRYNIYDVIMGRGESKAGPLVPTAQYVHKLAVEKGVKVISLAPGFNIPAKETGSFELQLYTDYTEGTADISLDLEFVTNKGSIKTDKFNLVFEVVPK